MSDTEPQADNSNSLAPRLGGETSSSSQERISGLEPKLSLKQAINQIATSIKDRDKQPGQRAEEIERIKQAYSTRNPELLQELISKMLPLYFEFHRQSHHLEREDWRALVNFVGEFEWLDFASLPQGQRNSLAESVEKFISDTDNLLGDDENFFQRLRLRITGDWPLDQLI